MITTWQFLRMVDDILEELNLGEKEDSNSQSLVVLSSAHMSICFYYKVALVMYGSILVFQHKIEDLLNQIKQTSLHCKQCAKVIAHCYTQEMLPTSTTI